MGQHYDVIVIGGATMAWSTPRISPSSKKVVVLERRPSRRPALPKKSSPAFFFRMFLRRLAPPPRNHPRTRSPSHAWKSSRSTVPSLPCLAATTLAHERPRQIRPRHPPHSRLDAEAYDEFSKMMTPLPLREAHLSMVPPIPPRSIRRTQAASLPPSAFS